MAYKQLPSTLAEHAAPVMPVGGQGSLLLVVALVASLTATVVLGHPQHDVRIHRGAGGEIRTREEALVGRGSLGAKSERRSIVRRLPPAPTKRRTLQKTFYT